MSRNEEPITYVWTLRSLDGAHPKVGTLATYARDYELASITDEYLVSSSVWVANANGLLEEHVVKVERGAMNEDHRIPYTFRVAGETLTHFFDGAA